MASATVTESPEHPGPAVPRRPIRAGSAATRRGSWPLGSRLGRLIILLNLLGLAILIGGALILNELRQGLVAARQQSLTVEGAVLANVIDQYATVGDPEPTLEADTANNVLQTLNIPKTQRARLFDADGRLLADTAQVADRVEVAPLPPVRKPGQASFSLGFLKAAAEKRHLLAQQALQRDVRLALQGETVTNTRVAENGRRVVSVSIPLQHVRAVLGVLTLQADDVDQIIAAERRALIPFILIAVGVTLLSSLLLIQRIAEPVLRLARAADRVRLQRARAIALPDISSRDDEIGDLARALEDMTEALSERMRAIERFAADVAHELRNPMTSIRSAVETLELVKTAAPRTRLLQVLQKDVDRMDRLITDISNASRVDAELARETPTPLDLTRLLADICGLYEATRKPGEIPVRFIDPGAPEPRLISGREGPLSQVFRNLVDNARSFSPAGGEVRVGLRANRDEIVAFVDDDGPGLPAESLEKVFQRFYTSRPKGAAFGGNSGLGLAIARQIVDAHGGRIWAENREREGVVTGARFCVALPTA